MPAPIADHPLQHRSASTALITIQLTAAVAATYGFGLYLFAQLVTDMRAELGFDYQVVGTITAAGQLGFLVFAVIGSWLAARIGGGAVILASLALCGVCLVALPTTSSILVIGILLTILGGTAASVYVPMVDVVARTVSLPHRGKVLGLIASGTSYGVFVNSLLVPVFSGPGDWRGAWTAVGIATLAAAFASLMAFRRLGLLKGVVPAATKPASQGTAAHAGRLVTPWVIVISAITFLNGFSTMPFQTYLSPFLREELALGVDLAAWVWRIIGVVGMFAGFILGWTADRAGVRAALLLAYGCFAAAAVILALSPVGYLPLMAGLLFATAFYPIFGLVSTYIANKAADGTATTIFGIANITLGVGGMSGNYLASQLAAATDSFAWVYVAIAVAAALLAILTLLLPRERAPSLEGAAQVNAAQCG